MDDKNVYGSNKPEAEDTGVPTIREMDPKNAKPKPEKGVDRMLDDQRNQEANDSPSGGMGRDGTPRDNATQGEWHREA
ncbi:MAG: hypothetical protein QOJ65_2271 [Fimbriimonadaceae bacterium]|jgi:hypothetical protein|nr:hypothetical protein [Fimbriimonadaceae bacterium]